MGISSVGRTPDSESGCPRFESLIPSQERKVMWKLWAKALGEKASQDSKESDRVAIIRTLIIITYLITNAFIVAGVIRHW